MKRFLCLICAVMMLGTAVILGGCNEEKKDASPSSSSGSQSSSESGKTSKTDNNSISIKSYLNSFIKGDNEFYGAWQIDGFEYMTILFRNDQLAELVTGTEGYFSDCSIDKAKHTVTLQLMPNVIDGAYSYKFSDDNKTLTLTLDGNSIKLIKTSKYSLLPKAPKKPKIDEDILGWWESEQGTFCCFEESGIMYDNSISFETCYTYNADKTTGKIKAVYTSSGEMDEEFTYSYKDGTLTLNGTKYTPKEME